ncbi:MAG: 5'-methylthioadenosine/adenosylhomocysteine nucleosidase [Bacillota bacterium]
MKIGLLTAMADESHPLFQEIIKSHQTKYCYRQEINAFAYGKHDFVHYTCGVGKANAALGVTLLALTEQPDCLIMLGTAGAIDPRLNIGDVVVGEKMYNHDLDATSAGFRSGEIPFAGREFCADEGLLAVTRRMEHELYRGYVIRHGNIAAGDRFVSDESRIAWIREEFMALCVDMEDASAAMVSEKIGIPFLAVRAISDYAASGAFAVFSENMAKASKNAVDFMLELAVNLK